MAGRRVHLGARLAAAACLLGATIAVGCTAFSGDAPEPTGDAGDAGNEGASTTDAAVDANATDSAVVRFCTTSDAAFCADFEQGLSARGWALADIDGGALTIVPGNAPFPNANALSSVVDYVPRDAASDVDISAAAYLVAQAGANRGASLEMDIRIDEPPDAGFVAAAAIVFDFNSQAITLNVLGDSLLLFVIDPTVDVDGGVYIASTARPTGWFHLRLDASFGIDGGTLVFVDGVKIFETRNHLSPAMADYVATLGLSSNGLSRARVTYDNVTLRPLQ